MGSGRVIAWRQDGGLLTAWADGDKVATVYKDGCEWLVVGPGLASGFKWRSEAIGYVEREWAKRAGPDVVPGPVGEGAGPAV